MITELRRSRRNSDFLPLKVTTRDGVDNSVKAGPFSGRILNLSHHGACLLMSQVIIGAFHVFYSTLENDSFYLLLEIPIPPTMELHTINARPVWLDSYRRDSVRAFKMGVDFITSPEGRQMALLQEAIKLQQNARANRWQAAEQA
jgi:hypothetical protein